MNLNDYRETKTSKYSGKFTPNQDIGHWQVDTGIVLYDSKSRAYVICKCLHCNTLSLVDCHHLDRGRTTKCKKCNYSIDFRAGNANPNWSVGIPNQIKKYMDQFNIKIHDSIALELLHSQQYSCSITGKHLFVHNDPFGEDSYNARLVPKDPSGSIIPENLTWVHRDVAKPMLSMGQQNFIDLCKLVTEKYR